MRNKVEFEFKGFLVRFYDYGIEVIDSYKLTKTKEIRAFLEELMGLELYKEYNFMRKISSYIAEWKFHNFCYRIHFKRNSAKDVFLDKTFPRTARGRIESAIYKILSIFY